MIIYISCLLRKNFMILINKKDQNFKKFTIQKSQKISKAIDFINKNKSKFVFVLDDKKILGIITDGDLRRFFRKNKDLNKKCIEAANLKPKKLKISKINENSLKKSSEDLCFKYQINQIPIIDKKNNLLSIFLSKSDYNSVDLCAFIFAGGLGKRLLPLTKTTPKALIEVNGISLINRIIYQIKQQKIKKIFISVNHLKNKIIKSLGNGSKFGVEIEYIEEKKPLGTCGSLSLLKNINYKNILVMNCDIHTTLNVNDLTYFHNNNSFDMTICSKQITHNIDYGILEVEKLKLKDFREKPSINYNINAGLYLINVKLLKHVPKNKYYNMNQFINVLNSFKKYNLGVYQLIEEWADIGNLKELNKVNDTK